MDWEEQKKFKQYDKVVFKKSGTVGYTIIADGIHRGFLSNEKMAELLGDQAERE